MRLPMSAPSTPLSAFACEESNEFGSDTVRLAWGQRPDGTIMHIAEVERGLACNCVCPGCGRPLVARHGERNADHFAHHVVGECRYAPETALHKFAKQILNEHRRILLPPVQAEYEDQILRLHQEREFTLDDAVLENRLGSVVPDVIARKGEKRLMIEVAVSHFCDAEKIEKIRVLEIAAIEVDLSDVPRDAPKEIVAEAILKSAPRRWLHNPKIVAGVEKLRERAASTEKARQERRAAGLRSLRTAVESARTAAPDPKVSYEASGLIRRVQVAGYDALIGVALEGDFAFRVPRRYWQAIVIDVFVLMRLRQDWTKSAFQTRDVFEYLRKRELLHKELGGFIDDELEAAVRQHIPDFRRAYHVVHAYLEHLEDRRLLDQMGWRWEISTAVRRAHQERESYERQKAQNREAITKLAREIYEAIPVEDRGGFDVESWLSTPRPEFGCTPLEMADPERKDTTLITFRLHSIQSMLRPGGSPTEELYGFPIERIRSQRQEERRLRREQELKRQADMRQAARVEEAKRYLSDAETWARKPCAELDGRVPADVVRETREGLEHARRALDLEFERREAEWRRQAAEAERQRKLAQLREELTSAANRAFVDPERAQLWLRARHPGLRQQRPLDYCVDQNALQACLALLPGARRR
jgi:hypothetical protein